MEPKGLHLDFTYRETEGVCPSLKSNVEARVKGEEKYMTALFICLLFKIYFYFWLCWVFVVARGLSLVAASGGYSLLRCPDSSLRWFLLLRHAGSAAVTHGL